MNIGQTLLSEYDHEMATTRKVLERVPEDKFGWKPHEKSMSLGRLAIHVSEMPGWTDQMMKSDFIDLGGAYTPPDLKTTKEVLALFDKNAASGRAALESASNETMMAAWSLKAGDKTFFTMPRVAVLRTMVFNHVIHHRGQLSVYLRLNNVPVPSIYGPSADEPM